MFEVPIGLHCNSRTYSVIRVHDSKTTAFNDQDSNPNKTIIETDKFSTYALTYHEYTTSSTPTESNNSDSNSSYTTSSGGVFTSYESIHTPSKGISSEGNDNPATGIAISFVPLVAAFAIVTLAAKLRKK